MELVVASLAHEAAGTRAAQATGGAVVIARERALESLVGAEFDLVVIGGGITGAGVALDAASRGLTVALVERRDFAGGTSSRSTKLVHGGLRYLRGLHLRIVREALLERRLMLELAPRLVRPLPIVVPAPRGARRNHRLVGAGLTLYDLLALERGRNGERHRVLSGSQVGELVPGLAARRPAAGYLYHDCQVDDARLVLTVLAEAARLGAVCANRLEAVGVVEHNDRVAAVEVRDSEWGQRFRICTGHVINATGAWADRGLARAPDAQAPALSPSRGTHITLRRDDLSLNGAGVVVPAGGGRHISALPWLGSVLVGATDDHHRGDVDHLRPLAEDVDYLLGAVNAFFGTALRRTDVTAAFAGARPLVAGRRGRRSTDVPRKAELYEAPNGVITVAGGKLTTWRRMAERAVDRIVARDGREAPCRTHRIPLAGELDPARLTRVDGVPERAYPHLAARYGEAAADVLAIAAAARNATQPILEGRPDLLAEAVYTARHEQARSVGDVLLRRTRLGLLAAHEVCDPALAAPERVATAMAPILGWDSRRVSEEVAAWTREAEAEGLVVTG
jgi:glycerol-3-phosphate dehydrogenase